MARKTIAEVDQRLDSFERQVSSDLKEMKGKVDRIHDYMVGEQAKASSSRKQATDWQTLLKQLLTFLVIAATSAYALIEFFIKAAQK